MKIKAIIGVIIILMGFGFLVDELFAVNISDIVWNWWPIVLVILGLAQLKKAENILSPLMLIIFGLFILLHNLEIIPGNFWRNIVSLIFIFGGISILISQNRSKKNREKTRSSRHDLSVTSIFAGNHHIEDSNDLRSGNSTAIFGGVELDLRNATIQEEAFLELTCLFGGIEIKVPENWEIKLNGTPIFGGVENKTYNKNNHDLARPVLNINYLAMFGGVSLKN